MYQRRFALIKEVENVPAKILEYIGMNIQKEVGAFLTNLMDRELTDHVGREKYERKEGNSDYRNGSYSRTFCIKGIGDVDGLTGLEKAFQEEFIHARIQRCQVHVARNSLPRRRPY